MGKTSVPDVMFALRKLLAGEVKIDDRVAFHPSTLTRWQAGRNQVFEVQAGIGGESFIYRLDIEHDEVASAPASSRRASSEMRPRCSDSISAR